MFFIKTLSSTPSKLPQYLHEVLIGYVLGDGGIFYAGKPNSSPRFEFSIGQARLAFAQPIADLFRVYASNTLKTVQVQAVKGGALLTSYRFKTRSLPVFTYYRELFYKVNLDTGRSIKIVPKNILELLTPVSLAYLIMSDGNYDTQRNRVRIYTNSFTKPDVETLAKAILDKFGIYTAVMVDKPNQFIMTIGANELPKLQALISEHMHPTMKYRIGL